MKCDIKSYRNNRHLSQEELHTLSGVSRAIISKLESGEEVEVKMSTLERLASALKCKVSDFLLPKKSSTLDKNNQEAV